MFATFVNKSTNESFSLAADTKDAKLNVDLSDMIRVRGVSFRHSDMKGMKGKSGQIV